MAKKNDHPTLRETFSIHWRAAKDVHKLTPSTFPVAILSAIVEALEPYATIYFSARIIDELAGLRRPDVLMKWVLLTIGLGLVLRVLMNFLQQWSDYEEGKFLVRWKKLLTEKFLTMDFADIDKQQTMDLYTQIMQSANWSGWGINYLHMYCVDITQGLAGILGAATMTVSLFTTPVPAGSLTVLNSPLFLPVILAVMLAVTLISGWIGNQANAAWADFAESARFGNRVFSHFGFLYGNTKSHADLRLYRQQEMAECKMAQGTTFGKGSDFEKLHRGTVGLSLGASSGLSNIFTGLVYGYVCLKAWMGAFGIGSVTQYVGAVTAMSNNIRNLISTLGHMQSNTGFLKTTYEFLDIPNAMYQGSLTTEKRADRQYEVEFRDVSFKYPGADNWALRHVNMKFQVGKRLAIVGENGSGKTTFIKLLCRLYDPQEGQILLNGIDIRKYNYRDYMDIFSIVFQDFQLISQPLGNNVAGAMEYDRERAEKCLRDAGFGDRLTEMPEGLETYLYKDFGREGVNVSGGEAQKIAIARALYKDAPFIILDEPTAALDPIAEAEIYEKFDGIAGDKTAIYISHRLSSCKFCDEIAVFHEGAVIQQGRHAELVAEENGKYHELWQAQAQYYTNNE